jgi:hypothetical protein
MLNASTAATRRASAAIWVFFILDESLGFSLRAG